jgi:hypothetical protein
LKIALSVREETLAVARLDPGDEWPGWALSSRFVVLARTEGELSVVCPEESVPRDVRAERGWRAFQVDGPLDFTLTGVLAGLLAPLATAGIAVFVVSTFDTDFVLVREGRLKAAIDALRAAGYEVRAAL